MSGSRAFWRQPLPYGWHFGPLRELLVERREWNVNAVETRYLSLLAGKGVIPYEEKGDVGNRKPDDLARCKRVFAGDFVINSMNFQIGSYGRSSHDGVCSPVYIVLTDIPGVGHPGYLSWLLSVPGFQVFAQSFGNGILDHRRSIGWSDLKGLIVPVPPLDEQRRIADFLDDQVSRIDQAIHLRKRQIELLKEQQISMLRFETTRGGGKCRATGIAWMPEVNESWPLVRVGAAFTTGSGSTPPSDNQTFYDGGIPWLLTGDLNDGVVTETKRTISELAISRFGTLRTYPAGSLVIAMYGATIGRLGLLGMPASVNQACCVLTNATTIDTSFAYYWFLGQRSEIVNLGAGGGQPNISQELVRNLRIPVPGEHEQRSIITRLDQITVLENQLLERQSDAIALLEERKRSLITAAVTGEFDVSSASSRAAGVASGGV